MQSFSSAFPARKLEWNRDTVMTLLHSLFAHCRFLSGYLHSLLVPAHHSGPQQCGNLSTISSYCMHCRCVPFLRASHPASTKLRGFEPVSLWSPLVVAFAVASFGPAASPGLSLKREGARREGNEWKAGVPGMESAVPIRAKGW